MSRGALVLVVLTLACHRAPSAVGPGLNARREANLRELASDHLRCPAASLTVRFIETLEPTLHLYRVEGCGGVDEALLHCAGLCVWMDIPDRRAALDLSCPPPNPLLRTYLGQGLFGVAGCGHSVQYVASGGRWVVSGAGPDGPPPVAPGPASPTR